MSLFDLVSSTFLRTFEHNLLEVLKYFPKSFRPPLLGLETFMSRCVSRIRPAENADGGIEAIVDTWQSKKTVIIVHEIKTQI